MISSPVRSATPVWFEDFEQPLGTGPNPAHWTYDLGATGWGNAELQRYTDSRENSFVVADPEAVNGKALVIRAVRQPDGTYTSARLKTQGKLSVTSGRIEARIKIPRGQGIWPAFWMLGESIETIGWPACGEIDIMEVVGHEPHRLHQTLHGPGYSAAAGITKSMTLPEARPLSDGYHVYSVEWSTGRIAWFLDGRLNHVCTPADLPAGGRWVFDHAPFFLLLNLAVGGRWPGYPDDTTTFPQEMRIDYVRVTSLNPSS